MLFEQEIALHQVLRERDFYGCPGMYLVPIRPIKEHKAISLCNCAQLFSGLRTKAFSSEVLEDQENS
jgi:hypothetical protein